ncbi:uncharacterized protein PV09_07997 [Verruconis gallopava]|uniref:Uncharacterized protein n=1 Tax=Verruconis gallopava TaxID=253628 RepID=A0A0D2AMY1_9PEZI|nr:uncharacterized protein PV09_07997 [Verruconis gallopava]KIW00474.1 hypothetical protein PV09_07997 [Verruconis gallopava]
MVARELELAGDNVPVLEAATPGSGTYLIEANSRQTNWQREFHGDKDPEGVFYAVTALRSELRKVDGKDAFVELRTTLPRSEVNGFPLGDEQ